MKKYTVTIGLGRMASNHRREFLLAAASEQEAVNAAERRYREEVGAEIGRDNPIWNKFLTVESVVEER